MLLEKYPVVHAKQTTFFLHKWKAADMLFSLPFFALENLVENLQMELQNEVRNIDVASSVFSFKTTTDIAARTVR